MSIKKTVKTEFEYEEAPSGFVTFYNYKEPLMEFQEGFGFVGALLFDGETETVQCHLCGEWLNYLPHHLHKEHNMTAGAYKQKVGLLKNTALISEKARENLIKGSLAKRKENLRPGKKQTPETRKKISDTLKENAQKSEGMNLRGTCPAQLIHRMQTIYKQNGEDFRLRDFNYFEGLLRSTFGSVKEACLLAGIPYRKPGQNYSYDHVIKHKKHDLTRFVVEFIGKNKRTPTFKDFCDNKLRIPYEKFIKNKTNLPKFVKEAVLESETYIKTDLNIQYSKEELLNFLKVFEKHHGRKPTYSDSRRGLIPHLSRYSYHFGSWKNALKEAFN